MKTKRGALARCARKRTMVDYCYCCGAGVGGHPDTVAGCRVSGSYCAVDVYVATSAPYLAAGCVSVEDVSLLMAVLQEFSSGTTACHSPLLLRMQISAAAYCCGCCTRRDIAAWASAARVETSVASAVRTP